MTTRVIGIFDSLHAAAQSLEQIREAGFANEDISVLFADTDEGREYLTSEQTQAATGAWTGGAIGGALTAVAATALALPGVGILAAGPILAALGGAGLGAASGGLLGALVGLGIPQNEAALRLDEVQAGAVLVGVEAEGDGLVTATEILKVSRAAYVVETESADHR